MGEEETAKPKDDNNVMEWKTAGGKKIKENAKHFALSLWIWRKHILPEDEGVGNRGEGDGQVTGS